LPQRQDAIFSESTRPFAPVAQANADWDSLNARSTDMQYATSVQHHHRRSPESPRQNRHAPGVDGKSLTEWLERVPIDLPNVLVPVTNYAKWEEKELEHPTNVLPRLDRWTVPEVPNEESSDCELTRNEGKDQITSGVFEPRVAANWLG
jgi:hypothetical protein